MSRSIDWKVFYAATVLVSPYAFVYGFGMTRWAGRATGAALLIFGITAGVIYLGVSSESMVRPGGRLVRPEYARARQIVEAVSRGAVLLFATFFVVVVAAPFAIDLMQLTTSNASVVERGQIVRVRGTFLGMPIIKQSVYLRRGGQTSIRSYTLLYSFDVLRAGEYYELRSMPRSKIILEYRRLDMSDVREEPAM